MQLKLYVIILLCLLLMGCSNHNKAFVYIKDKQFTMEIAKTPGERKLGLMHRKSLDLDKGMLFIFEEEKPHSFWMKNTLIPLDIIWLNNNKNVVYFNKNTQPCSKDPCIRIYPNKNASYVVEINANLSDKLGLKIGDEIKFKHKVP